jgi:hypothetical protein
VSDEDEFVDRIWRDGLASAAAGLEVTTDPRARVAARVRHRRRRRRGMSAGFAAVMGAAALAGVVQLGRPDDRTRIATRTAVQAVVRVNEAPGGALRIDLPGRRPTGNPASITLPSGLIRFEFYDSSPGHLLRIEGVPGFEVEMYTAGETITRDVRLEPGTYVLYCAVAGHREAGEAVRIVVGS